MIQCKTSSYVAVVAYGQSFPAPCKKSAQVALNTVATTLRITGSVEAVNDACHSVWGIVVKTSTTSARAAIGRLLCSCIRYGPRRPAVAGARIVPGDTLATKLCNGCTSMTDIHTQA